MAKTIAEIISKVETMKLKAWNQKNVIYTNLTFM